MDWTTIGYITLASIIYSINFYVWVEDWSDEGDIILSGAVALASGVLEVIVCVALYMLGTEVILKWGIGNFLLSSGIVTTIVGGPYLAKPLAKRIFVAIPHYTQKFFAECRTYKNELEIKAPIKRSVYELIGDE